MRIDRVDLKHFGRFDGVELIFGDGINLITGSNESGKTTLHAFIRGMLFGIDKNRGRAGKNDVYSRYLPWDTPGAYQGSLDLEHEGQKIRITRVFLQNARKCTVTDIDHGNTLDWKDSGITALIPELTPSAFDNTVSCMQQQIRTKDDFGACLRSFIAGMAGARSVQTDVSSALESLENKSGQFQKEIRSIDAESLSLKLKDLSEDEKDENYMLEDREKERGKLRELEREREELDRGNTDGRQKEKKEELLRLSERIRQINKVRDEILTCRAKAEELSGLAKESEDKIRLSEEAAGNAKERLRVLRTGEDSLESKRAETVSSGIREKLDTLRSGAEKAKAVLEKESVKTKKLFTAAAVLEGCGAAAAIASSDRFGAGIITGIVLMIAGLVVCVSALVSSKEKKRYGQTYIEAQKEALSAQQEADEIGKEREKTEEALAAVREQLQKTELELKSIEGEDKENRTELKNIRERENELSEKINELENTISREVDYILRRLNECRDDAAEKELSLADNESCLSGQIADKLEKYRRDCLEKYEEHEKRRKILDESIAEKKNELARIDGALSGYGDIGEKIEETSKELNAALKRIGELKTELEAVRMASGIIRDITDDLKGSFDRYINEMLSEACCQVTAGKYETARLGPDYEPLVSTGTEFVPAGALSAGTAEQIALGFRLSMARLLFGNICIPLFFDEAFAYYDDERLVSAIEGISGIKDRQIFIFSCNGREKQILDLKGIPYHHICLA